VKLINLYKSVRTVRTIKLRERWAGHINGMGETTNVYRILVRKPLVRSRRWEDNYKMETSEMDRTGSGSCPIAVLTLAVLNIRVILP
jgi:hypothetical protein